MYWARSGNLDLHEAFDRHHERYLVGETRHPVDAIDEGGDLRVRPDLRQLLVAAVHVADHRFDVDDPLAIELGDQPEHPVRRGMLRTDVDRHPRRLQLNGNRYLRNMGGRPGIKRLAHARSAFDAVGGGRWAVGG